MESNYQNNVGEKKMQEEINPPVKVGEKLKLGVTKFGKDGDPIMEHKGFVIFLKGIEKRGVQLSTMIEIKITKVLPKFAFAERVDGS